jgi:serine O-acetyltransferase
MREYTREENLSEITDALYESYRLVGRINNTDGSLLPSKGVIADICKGFLQLLFPGVYGEEPIYSPHLRNVTANRLRGIATRLVIELSKSSKLDPPLTSGAEAEQSVLRCLKRLPEIREVLETDIEAAYEGDPAAVGHDEVIVAYPFLEAVAIQRVAHLLYIEKLPMIPRIMTEWAHSRTGIDLSPGTEIGSHFFIDHGTGVVVGETSKIGSYVKLYQGVALIARSLSAGQALHGQKRHPSLEDKVTVYSGSTIMGGDTVVGAGSTIGANVFLTHSVPTRSVVYHDKGRLQIRSKDDRAGPLVEDWMI